MTHRRGLWLSTVGYRCCKRFLVPHQTASWWEPSLSVVTSAWEWLIQSVERQDTGCCRNRDSWKIQAVSRQCSFTVLTMNAVAGQPAFVLATEQELSEKVKSECKSMEERKLREWMQGSRNAPTPPCFSLSHAKALPPTHSTNQAPRLSLSLKKWKGNGCWEE